jgi:hypothetical protein
MTDHRYLTGDEFTRARELLRERLGMKTGDLIEALGTGNNQPARWSRDGCPKYVALAITALLHGLEPWPHRAKPKHHRSRKPRKEAAPCAPI